MVSKKVVKMLNDQIALEGDSSQVYLAMATWADVSGYQGTASFMYTQAEEERMHMHKFITFLSDVGEYAKIPAVKEPKANYKGIDEVFADTLKHEQRVTAAINKIMTAARANDDHQVASFLQWFVDEQVEEEATANKIIDIIKIAGKPNLYLVDKEIGAMRGAKGTAASGAEA